MVKISERIQTFLDNDKEIENSNYKENDTLYIGKDIVDYENNEFTTWDSLPNIQKDTIEDMVKTEYPEMCEEFDYIDSIAKQLFYSKQSDYGPTNIALGRTLKNQVEIDAAIIGVVVRLRDKAERLLNLVLLNRLKEDKGKPKNESIEDSLIDIHNYANIALIVKNGKWAK